ncbi:hypothetical protein [Proteiniphilum saccharofermentans]
MGDLVYSTALFGLFEASVSLFPSLRKDVRRPPAMTGS